MELAVSPAFRGRVAEGAAGHLACQVPRQRAAGMTS
jgi:hypothetical protein